MGDIVKKRFPVAIYRGLIIDLEDRMRGEAQKAHRMIQDHSGLDPRRARALEGLSRFHMMEKGFQEVCELHGGEMLEGGAISENPALKFYQPFMRFGDQGQGFILSLAAMPEASTLPTKNKSRLAGVTLNYQLSPRFDFNGKGPQIGDIFISLLFSRDREIAGKIEELAIGLISSEYDQFLFYERIDEYLAGGGEVSEPSSPFPTPPSQPSDGAVRLKGTIKPFVPPEALPSELDEDGKA
ncbi:MAG: hypothetical protein AAF683_01910 [Pseudomonadota bacterium]